MSARVLPVGLRRTLQQLRRAVADHRGGLTSRWVREDGPRAVWPARLTLSQPIRPGPSADAKRHNLRLAAARLEDRVVMPGAVLSLGHLIGPPTRRRGFRAGRMLSGDRIIEEEGGGLCQLSGVLYLLGLRAGLSVIERHPHSLDIYTEETRFCPLGADATLVWAYKDLRLANPLSQPLSVQIRVEEAAIHASLGAPAPLVERDVRFERQDQPDGTRRVTTWVDARILHIDHYRAWRP